MDPDEEDDTVKPESLPIYRKGKEIFEVIFKISTTIPGIRYQYITSLSIWYPMP